MARQIEYTTQARARIDGPTLEAAKRQAEREGTTISDCIRSTLAELAAKDARVTPRPPLSS